MGIKDKLGFRQTGGISTQQLDLSQPSIATYDVTGTAVAFQQKDGELDEESKERPQWGSKAEFILSCIGFSVGLGNVWRFPYLAYKNGGGAFLLPYIFMLLLCGLPMYYMEVAIGQYFSRGPIQCWRAICPLFSGVGYAMLVVSLLVAIYYNVIMSWVLFYLFDSFRKDVPWRNCKKEWGSTRCNQLLSVVGNGTKIFTNTTGVNVTICQYSFLKPIYRNGTSIIQKCVLDSSKRVAPSEEYWNHNVLKITDGIDNPGQLRWQLVLALLLAWVVVYFCMCKGIKSAGKVVYFTATFPYVVLIILLVRGVTLPGASDGVILYIKPDFKKMKNPEEPKVYPRSLLISFHGDFKPISQATQHMYQGFLLNVQLNDTLTSIIKSCLTVWAAAATQLFYSLGVAFGSLLSMASYNNFKNNCLRDAITIACVDSCTSSLAGFVIFSVLGYMAHQLNLDVKDVVASGPGLAFVVYPEGVQNMPISPLWAILFFFMLFTLGLDSEFAMLECVITNIIDEYPRKLKKWKSIAILVACIFCFLIGLSCVCEGGMYVFNLFDYQSGGVSLLFIASVEVITIGWFYGSERLRHQVSQMIGYYPNPWWSICWRFVTPTILLTIFIFTLVNWGGVSYNDKKYPAWAEFIGWCFALSSMLMIPIMMIVTLWKTNGDSFMEKLQNAVKPDEEFLMRISKEQGLPYGQNHPIVETVKK